MTIMGLLGVCSKFLSQDEAMKPIHTAIEDREIPDGKGFCQSDQWIDTLEGYGPYGYDLIGMTVAVIFYLKGRV